MEPWDSSASLEKIATLWDGVGTRAIAKIDQGLKTGKASLHQHLAILFSRALLCNYVGDPAQALESLGRVRRMIDENPSYAKQNLYSIIYSQGISGLRLGENENCIMCRGESSCTLPISERAVHVNPRGSRMAVQYFTEYLDRFPNDFHVKWLLNLAHMTLGEYPDRVDPKYLVPIDRFVHSEFDVGRFRDVGAVVGLNRLNQSGGAIMDDFDSDGLLDIVTTCNDHIQPMTFFRNQGDGTFEDHAERANLTAQLGGLFCTQADYDNDGDLDIWVSRGAWLPCPIRPSLLRNNGHGVFEDVTDTAGVMTPLTSNSAAWADYDNDGWLDLFVCNEQEPSKLYHSLKDGTFEEVAYSSGIHELAESWCKGATWLDYDNDGWSDLFLNHLSGRSTLYHNDRNGTFSEVTLEQGIGLDDTYGFSCWAWDYDNDGWLDLMSQAYKFRTEDVVAEMMLGKASKHPARLYRNNQGKGFTEVSDQAGVSQSFGAMGSNFADFDNDGFLDFYLGTGSPNFGTLIPNRMFKNVAGQRFSEITGAAGTGNLQKGHAVACGDWDRDGDVDLFIEMGGAVDGDRYHNILYQNPGQGNHSVTVKLTGVRSNRSAIGARIKMVVEGSEDGSKPLTVHRLISSGSSFGANTLEQTLGMGKANRIATLEVHWPTSGTTQTFHDVAAGQSIEITEFATEYRTRNHPVIRLPE